MFAPSPELTVTIEEVRGAPDIHVHAGGQGVWQARMIESLGGEVVLCSALGGDTGRLLRRLIGFPLEVREVAARNGGYVHDRRDGDRDEVVRMPADALTRRESDELCELTLAVGLDAGVVVLGGPAEHDHPVPDAVYERLTRELGGHGCRVVVDLSGGRLAAALKGGPEVVKVSYDELVSDGYADSDELPDLMRACHAIAGSGPRAVVVTRAEQDTLALVDGRFFLVDVPELTPVDTRGGGDSMAAGLAVGLTRGMSLDQALRLGAAAGALTLTRHGLGSGGGETVRHLAERVRLEHVDDER
ncbi:PfkB family carbohydrate kinase [Saccharothrix longispora]